MRQARWNDGLGGFDSKPMAQLFNKLVFIKPTLRLKYFLLKVVELFSDLAASEIVSDDLGRQEQNFATFMFFTCEYPPEVTLEIRRFGAYDLGLKASSFAAPKPKPPVICLVIFDLYEEQLGRRSVFANEDIDGLLVLQRVNGRSSLSDVLTD